jgi:hypothetical protein
MSPAKMLTGFKKAIAKTNLSFEIKMKRKTIFMNSIKIGLTGACFILFLLLMREGWEKFSHKTAHTGIRFIRNPEESKVLPCVSFCTKEGFKRKGYFSNQSSFLENSYSAEEIFHPSSMNDFKNVSRFVVKATNILIAGRCYTVCSLEPANKVT